MITTPSSTTAALSLKRADFSTVTIETSLAGEEAGYSGYPMFRAPDALADALAGSGFDMINLASNHVYDGLDAGLLRTMDVLGEKNLLFMGTRTDEEQKKYNIVEVNGIKVGVLSYVYETTEEGASKSINSIPLSDEAAPPCEFLRPQSPGSLLRGSSIFPGVHEGGRRPVHHRLHALGD